MNFVTRMIDGVLQVFADGADGKVPAMYVKGVSLPSSGVAGRLVPSVDTPTELRESVEIESGVTITAFSDNQEVVNIVFDDEASLGLPLFASSSIFIEIDDPSKIYVVVSQAGDGVGYAAT